MKQANFLMKMSRTTHLRCLDLVKTLAENSDSIFKVATLFLAPAAVGRLETAQASPTKRFLAAREIIGKVSQSRHKF